MSVSKRKVLISAVCAMCWAEPRFPLLDLRKTLDKLVEGDYLAVPKGHLSSLITQLCLQEKSCRPGKEARGQIALDILNFNQTLAEKDLSNLDFLAKKCFKHSA